MANADKGREALDRAAAKLRLVGPHELREELRALWRSGLPPGDATGWFTLDRHYTVSPGQLTVITGWPSSGKSEFLDAMLVNLSLRGWRFAMFSAENQPVELHVAKLMEKFSRKPFGAGPNERISLEELGEYADQVAQSFRFFQCATEQLGIPEILEGAERYFQTIEPDAKRGLVIDPYNEIEHWRPPGTRETEYVSMMLSRIRNWGRAMKCHVWIAAHPAKQIREKGLLPEPTPDMIAGSQHWWNKPDCCLCVLRNFADPDSRVVEILVQKIRFKHIGRPGRISLVYDRVTGRYHEPGPKVVNDA